MRLVGHPSPFQFDLLEDAVYSQYGAGKSTDLAGQAARFFVAMLNKAPFALGTKPTAFGALLAFLKLNGTSLKGDPLKLLADPLPPVAEVKAMLEKALQPAGHDHHTTSPKEAMDAVLGTYGKKLANA